jgi:O-acetylhomoserine (thiol)-lyase
MHDETIAIHGGYTADSTRAVAVPIYQTIAHDFIDAEHAGAVLDLEVPGFHYNRINNPTNDVLERRIAALEGGTAALVLASGMAAVSYAILTVAHAGSNFVVAPQLYGATFTYFAHVLPTLGIEARFAADDTAGSIAAQMDEHTCAVFCESIGNPAGNVVDLRAVADVAHRGGVPLIVDNTVATPLMLKPIAHGADVVVHSLTKFVGGHGTTLGGAIVDGGRFPWTDHAERFPMFTQPEPAFHDVVFARDFPDRPFVVRARSTQLRNTGATLSPFNAFLLLQGLETMAVRLERHEANTRTVAAYLAADRRVEWVSFAGFPDHPHDHHLRCGGGLCRRAGLLRRAAPLQAAAQPGGRQVTGHPPGQHDAPSTERGRAAGRRRAPRNHQAVHRARACGRSHRGHRPGARPGGEPGGGPRRGRGPRRGGNRGLSGT